MYAYIQLITGMVISPRQTLEQAVAEKKLFAGLFIYVLSLIFALRALFSFYSRLPLLFLFFCCC